jgi:hypothetical protein
VIFGRFGWLFTTVVCLALGYLLVWHRGFYFDDYANYAHLATRPILNAVLNSPFFPFPVRTLHLTLNLGAVWLLSGHELLVRLLTALGAGINALLLGWLVYRLLGSRLASVISGWLFLMPFYAQEAVLWTSATGYILAVGLGLSLLHTFWSTFDRGQITGRWLALGLISFVLTLLTIETALWSVAFIPIFGLMAAVRHNSWKLIKQSLFIFLWLVGLTILFFNLFYRSPDIVTERGELDLSLFNTVERSQEYFSRLFWMTLSSDWGWPLMSESFELGLATVFQSWMGVTLFAAAFIVLSLTVLTWSRDTREYLFGYGAGFILGGAGILWFVVALLFPAVLIGGQILEYRMLYVPSAGASITVGTLVWLITKRLSRQLWPKVFILVIGLILILSAVFMIGFARIYAARFSLDQQQLAAMVRGIPSERLPKNSILIPYNNDENLFGNNDTISMFPFGVLETGAAESALQIAYSRDDLLAFTSNRWEEMQLEYACKQEPSSNFLNIQTGYGAIDVPIDQIVMFSYEADEVIVVENLILADIANSSCTIHFPIAEELRRHNTPTTDLVVSTN